MPVSVDVPPAPPYSPSPVEDDPFTDDELMLDYGPAAPAAQQAPPAAAEESNGRRRRRRAKPVEPQDSKSFDLDEFDLPPDLTSDPAPSPGKGPLGPLLAKVMDGPLGKVLIPLAVILGSVAALRIGSVLWQISPFALLIPVIIAAVFVGRRYWGRYKVNRWYSALADAVAERGLINDALWLGPAVSLPAPDEPDRPLWNGIIVIYRKGVAWFPSEEAAEKKALWWKKNFSEVALVHRTGGPNGVGLDVHLQGGDVKCHQIPPGFADGVVEALYDGMYPVLDD